VLSLIVEPIFIPYPAPKMYRTPTLYIFSKKGDTCI